MLRFAYTRPDGGVTIVSAVPKEQIETSVGPLTQDEYVQHVLDRSIPADAADIHQLPEKFSFEPDRVFRPAWRQTGGVFWIDMPTARNIWRQRMRKARAPLLAELDVAYQRADEVGDAAEKARVVEQKQRLRDVTDTPAIDTAATPDALRAVWPTILNR